MNHKINTLTHNMNNFFILIIIILSMIFFNSCNNKNSQIINNNCILQESGEIISFHVPDSIFPFASSITYQKEDTVDFLYFLSNKNQILTYRLPSMKLYSITTLDYQGDNGVGKCNGLVPISDSLFLINSRSKKSLLYVDNKGRIAHTIDYSHIKTASPPFTRQGLRCHFLNDKKILIPQSMSGFIFQKSKSEVNDYKIFLLYDPKDNSFFETGMTYPYIDEPKITRDWNFSVTQNDDAFIISFNSYHDLFITKDFKNYERKHCESKNFYGIPGLSTNSQNPNEIIESIIKNCTYYDIIWDKYNNIYYRIYKIGNQKIESNTDIFELNKYPDKIGVMVLDENFNIIVDQLLTPSRFIPYNYFVSSKGLYMALGPNCKDYDINSIQFELLKLKK